MELGQNLKIKPLSVNAAWQGRRFKTIAYKAFQKECLLILRPGQVHGDKLSVSLEFGFSSRNCDIDNPIKLFMDCICKKYGFDDRKVYKLTVTKKIVDKGSEYIKFKITELK